MIIKNFFEKDINRNIETVIKADDRDHISTEVAEYVITKEIANKIRDLFGNYTSYSGSNGVWISGFFGSGKSHLLKILSYVLENKEVDGYKCGELFAEKIEDDVLLKGDILSSTRIPSESVLFNIDQQAQITTKDDPAAILKVFYKVFYDHVGYYGFQPHVAEFEMWLDKQGKYTEFKSKFENNLASDWDTARIDYFDPRVTKSISEVLGGIFDSDPSEYNEILEKLEEKQKQSIEDFAQKVNEYLKTKPSGFRLNFFVDEVGQFISENTKLMLNLQTIAESLATVTRGQSWILVTSQEDMEKIVGDMNKSQNNDFSRIQARFNIKVPLTSANVDEVIEKRLLKKKPEVQINLAETFKKESAHLDTLLSFSDSGVQFKGFKGENDFANKLPFIPYQFDLFQQCRIALASHNAFQGKHASVGERSMLGVFQQVIQNIEKESENALVSFDLMFDGLRNELKGQIQNTIQLAERNIYNDFSIKVLKTLFLVKYYGNFKTTKRNISVLMINQIDIDLKQHELNIDEALNLLENQSYVQRNGEVYEFLTDEEKDIEQEIKNTDVEEQKVTQLLKEIFFDDIIRENKIKYFDTKQDYEFTSKIDGALLGREKELAIEIITENYSDYNSTAHIQAQTIGSTTMKIVLPSNATFMKDLKMYLRTDTYSKQNQSTSNKVEVKRILQEKAIQNVERRKNLLLLANKILSDGAVYMNGEKIQSGNVADGKTMVVNSFQNLVKTVYVNLRMLGNIQYSEETFKSVIFGGKDSLFATDDNTMVEGESEILNVINRRKGQSDRTSLNDLKNHFSKKPYGWYQNAVWTLVAQLYKRGKVELKKDSNNLEDNAVVQSLLNSASYSNVMLEPQSVIDPKLVVNLKRTYSEAFNETSSKIDAKEVATEFKEKLTEMYNEVSQLEVRKTEFQFLANLTEFRGQLHKLKNKEYSYYLTNLKDFEDDLLDAKENILDPINKFINGDQLKIYEKVTNFLKSDLSNVEYVEGNEFTELKSVMEDRAPYKGNIIRDAKVLYDNITRKLHEKIEEEKIDAIQKAEEMIMIIKTNEDYGKLSEADQTRILLPFQQEIDKLRTQRYIGNMRNTMVYVSEFLYTKQLNEIVRLATPEPKVDPTLPTDDITPVVARVHYVRGSSIKTSFTKTELRTEDDVNEYVESIRQSFLEKIKEHKRISL
ncbi:BREX system P-loop protein BrxC [Chryseobacterium wangxinyae]|uniref:BREX system P-loop protein BrxC n=1 Tax=Chryseobacterium sp. CY353 TaxID=2997334 RepID=UPI002270FC85|nr:BREX system P-loop protein BrxC [Chryseobacterium sp. CY353]MCY0970258.1 BREX system P-loop protein BrxC [Chryseobacterium sp. CY353]